MTATEGTTIRQTSQEDTYNQPSVSIVKGQAVFPGFA